MGANPNTLTASIATYMSRRMQRKRFKTNVFEAIASFEERSNLKKGNTVNRPYRSDIVENPMGADGSYSVQAITDTNEQLVINHEREASFYIKELDEIQHEYNVRNQYADDLEKVLTGRVDALVMAEVLNAASVVDAGDVGGTAGQGIALSTSNVPQVFSVADQKLAEQNVEDDMKTAIYSPYFYSILQQMLAGKATSLGDKLSMNGRVGDYFGYDNRRSNNLTWTGVLGMATNPTANDTVVVNGVTFKFVASVGTTAGNVLIGADADASRANLAAAINAGSGAGTTYIEVSAADRKKLKDIAAADDATANTLTITAKGYGKVTCSETLTAAGDVWDANKSIQHNLFGRKGAIDLVIQRYPKVDVRPASGKIGNDIVAWTVYGIKTFQEGTKELVDVRVKV